MPQFRTIRSNVGALLAGALLAALANVLATEMAFSDLLEPAVPEASSVPACASKDLVVVYQAGRSHVVEVGCEGRPRSSLEAMAARAYLIATARPGYTMMRQGPELAIGRLHPEFVVRLANAIREAKISGLPFAGIFSAYRPPAFGIGGFIDKFNSLHTYGLAVDVHGIGGPGSPEAERWHEIAAKHGVVCPYGPHNPAEWNHCQPTRLKIIVAENPLRETVAATGPLSLHSMFEAGSALLRNPAVAPDPDKVAAALTAPRSTPTAPPP